MILVTGATGMVGGHLVWQLLQENNRVVALKRKDSDVENIKSIFRFLGDNADELFQKISWQNADVEDLGSLIAAFEGVQYVYHCAAMVDLGKNSNRMIEVNAGGTKNVVDASLRRGVKKICFVSSIAALPNGNGKEPIDEETPFRENERTSTYGDSKRLAEVEIRKGIEKGLEAVIVNPGVILGYSKNMTGSGELFKRVRKGLPFYTNGITGYVTAQDVAKAMILLMKSDVSDERYILVGENKTHKDILQEIADGYGKFRPFLGMNKSLLASAKVLEFLGKVFRFTPLIDTSSAKISISKKTYSNDKFLRKFPDFQFSSTQDEILRICAFDKNEANKTIKK